MNSSILRLILIFLFFNIKLSQTKDLVTDDDQINTVYHNKNNHLKLTDQDDSHDKIFDPINNHHFKKNSINSKDVKSNDQQTLTKQQQKPINCDRVDSEFFRYLLGRYNKDNQQTGRMKRLCNNLEYAATHCNQQPNKNNLFDLIQNSNQLNEDDFNFSQSIIKLCPLILFRLQKKTCTAKSDFIQLSSSDHPRPHSKHVWIFTFLFVTVISCCSLVGVIVMPFANNDTESYKDAFNLFEGLAVGSLLASSLFHLLPQAFNLTANKSDDYLCKAMLVFGGIYLFFWSEILMKLVAELKKRKKKKSICQTNLELLENEIRINEILSKNQVEINGDINSEINGDMNGDIKNSNKKVTIKNDKDEAVQPQQVIATVAWMIIFGDGLHNFIDGLSIGAAFSESIFSGISVSTAVIFEELPHELGDFAVLIASGMTMKQAIGYNFLSACTCYLGAIFGIIVGDLTSVSDYILGFSGGMFLWLALVNIMSELTSAIDDALLKSKTKMFKVIFYQNVGILIGILFLFLLAKYGDQLSIIQQFEYR